MLIVCSLGLFYRSALRHIVRMDMIETYEYLKVVRHIFLNRKPRSSIDEGVFS